MSAAFTPGAQNAVLSMIAYQTHSFPTMRIVPAPVTRDWMDETSGGFAKRCLPLLIANQSGWHILSSHRVRVIWDGGEACSSIHIEFPGGWAPFPVSSHFGYGIVTWIVPYLFRTPPGFNLLVRGPANLPKDGASPLEGCVETDWAVSSFTMNWKMTRPGAITTFEKDEPICMILPQRRGELEQFYPEVRPLDSNRDIAQSSRSWADGRKQFLEGLRTGQTTEMWQKHYFKGITPDGEHAEDHQTQMKLRSFSESTNGMSTPQAAMSRSKHNGTQ